VNVDHALVFVKTISSGRSGLCGGPLGIQFLGKPSGLDPPINKRYLNQNDNDQKRQNDSFEDFFHY